MKKKMGVWEIKVSYRFDDIEDTDPWNIHITTLFDAEFDQDDIINLLFNKFNKRYRCVRVNVTYIKDLDIEI